MTTKEQQPTPSMPKLVKLNKAFKLAEQWVISMAGHAEEEVDEKEIEGRPSGLGLGARVPRKSQVGPINDPVERNLHKKLDARRRKAAAAAGDEESTPSVKNAEDDASDDDENLDSRTNAFAKKRAAPVPTTPQAKKKPK